MRLKRSYSSREVAALTGLTARQLQWWAAHRIVRPSIPTRRTEAGGYTERRYSPVELLELIVLADLRRLGFPVPRLRVMLDTLRAKFNLRLFDVIEGGPLKLLTDGDDIYARTETGQFYSLVKAPAQPLLVVGTEGKLRELGARVKPRRRQPLKSRAKPKVAVPEG